MFITRCLSIEQPGWLEHREALWPDQPRREHEDGMLDALAWPESFASFMAYEREIPVGLVEIAIRTDYVNGTDSTPVAFLEGIHVLPIRRRQGIATKLVGAAENWACEQGCSEFASDAPLQNADSHAMHKSLGFEETERVVYFRKFLPGSDA